MEQLTLDFGQETKRKEFNIHTRLPVQRFQRGSNFVHVSTQKNFDIQVNDVVHVTSTERNLKAGVAQVHNVWKGALKDLPAYLLRWHESGLDTYEKLYKHLDVKGLDGTPLSPYAAREVEVVAIEYWPTMN